MLTRRQFLGSTAAATATLSVAACSGGKTAKTDTPFAHLASRAHEATPISAEEYAGRQQRARELMHEQGLDAMIVAEGTSLTYFSGAKWWGSERLFAMVLPAKGEPFYVCPAFEEARAREQVKVTSPTLSVDVRTWQEDESPYAILAQGVRDRGVATGRVGLEENVRFVFADGIAHSAPQVRLTAATSVTAGCRMIKSAHELALMRLASEVTLAAYEATWKSLRPGMTPGEITALSTSPCGFVRKFTENRPHCSSSGESNRS